MSFNGPLTGVQCPPAPEVKCAEPCIFATNEPCVIKCPDSRVIIYPPPVVVTFPGPILTTCPQESIVGSSGPPHTGLAESASAPFAAPKVTGSAGATLDRCPPRVITRQEPHYTPKYSYTSSSRSHPCNSYRSGNH